MDIGINGLTFFVGTWGELLVLQTPNIIIAQLLGAATVPLFAIPFQLYMSAYVLLNSIATPLWPAYAEARANDDFAWIRRTHWRVMKESLFLAFLGFLILGLTGAWLIRFWVGPEYVPPIFMSLIFTIQFIQWTVNYVFVILLTGLGFIRERTGIVLVFGLFNILFIVVFTNIFGLIGVALGLFFAMFLTQTWFLPWITFKKAKWLFEM